MGGFGNSSDHVSMTFEQMKELEQMYLQHDWEKLRHQAAIAAMQGLLADKELAEAIDEAEIRDDMSLQEIFAKIAVNYADALIKELKEKPL